MITIPKESSPTIDYGLINITTIYIGATPEDIDQLVTVEIEKAIKNISWIDTIESSSRLSVSSVNLTLVNDVNIANTLAEVKSEIDKIKLPSDVEDPEVKQISITEPERMFDMLIYAPTNTTSLPQLKEKASIIQNTLEWKNAISQIKIDGTDDYEIQVQIQKSKAEAMGLSLQNIAQNIQWYVTRLPLGNFSTHDTNYDYRFNKTITNESELKNISISNNNDTFTLWEVATIAKKYTDERVMKMGQYQKKDYQYVRLSFEKKPWANIFTSSQKAKEAIDKLMKEQQFKWYHYSYVQDIAKFINEDYSSLFKNFILTLLLVFLAVLLFVGLKESVIASLSIPLAFGITFIVLKKLGLSLNFMTNFSLIVTFGIAVDTIIVILEWAAEKIKLWYSSFSAVILSVKEFHLPLIAGTATTVVVFIPLFTLPGVMGKFLAYIPITIFVTLIAALFISLTINPAIFYLTTKNKKYFVSDRDEEKYLSQIEKTLLHLEREGKAEKRNDETTLRHKYMDILGEYYKHFLEKFLQNKKSRWITILTPIVLLIISFPLLAPQIWFKLFPSWDNPYIFIDISSSIWSNDSVLLPYEQQIDQILSNIQEIENYYYSLENNEIKISVELFSKEERKEKWRRHSFDVEKELGEKMAYMRSSGLKVELKWQTWWPPVGKAVGITLITNSLKSFETLKQVAKDFENFLSQQAKTKNISNSSQDTPWQFIFKFNKGALQLLWLKPLSILPEITTAINGIKAGVIEGDYHNHDIKVIYKEFLDDVTAQEIENIKIQTQGWPVRVGDIADYVFAKSINSIQREDGNIIIKVESDMEAGVTPTTTQVKLAQFTKQYNFPTWVSYQLGGENNDNSELIMAMGIAFVLSLIMIFSILVLQFNSFKQPQIIMYTVALALLGTNIGLSLTGNPYSMSFGIGFIALTGIVVNDAIVLIDRINRNRKNGMDKYTAITHAGKSRLQPIILTTITTILGLMSIVREDEFFAWLAFTIIFGLFVWSLMTLFVIPAIYYQFEKE